MQQLICRTETVAANGNQDFGYVVALLFESARGPSPRSPRGELVVGCGAVVYGIEQIFYVPESDAQGRRVLRRQ